MPLYEYQCANCQKITEVIQKFSDQPLTVCPEEGCGGALSKLLSSTSFALKGSGWYTTDYKRKSSPAKSSEVAPAEAKPADKPAATTAEKPKAKE